MRPSSSQCTMVAINHMLVRSTHPFIRAHLLTWQLHVHDWVHQLIDSAIKVTSTPELSWTCAYP